MITDEETIETSQDEKIIQNNQSTQSADDDKEKNWRAFLEKRKEEQKLLEEERSKNHQLEIDRKKQEEQIEMMKKAFEALANKKDSSDGEIDEDQKRMDDLIQRKFEERDKKREEEEKKKREIHDNLSIKQEMPDLVETLSHENLSYLEYYHPEIAIPLGNMPNGIEKTKLAYQAVKKHVRMNTKEKEKIEKNLSKPKSIHSSYSNENQQEESSGNTSDKKRQDTWNKMQRLISGEDEE